MFHTPYTKQMSSQNFMIYLGFYIYKHTMSDICLNQSNAGTK